MLVQDYHLALIGTWLAQQRKDLRAVHFTHIPFCDPAALRILPTDVAEELLVGMASHSSCGFHASRWADAFEACCGDVLGWKPSTFVAPLAPDHDDIEAVSASDECATEAQWLAEAVGDRALVLRVDRIELSKNLLRGFLAFDDLLRTRPEWRGKVVFAAFVYPSREGLPEYLAYRQEVETLAEQLNATWATPGWEPVLLDTTDNFARSVAALKRYDVLLVNPVRDGLNLVAKEGPLLNERDGVLALSREAGVWEELARCGPRDQPLRRGRHRRCARRRAHHDRVGARRARAGAARGGIGTHPPRVARRPAGRSLGQLSGFSAEPLEQRQHPRGPVDLHVGTLEDRGRALGAADTHPQGEEPVPLECVQRVERGEVAVVVTEEARRVQPRRELAHHRALVAIDRWPQLEAEAPLMDEEPGAIRLGVGPRARVRLAVRPVAVVQRHREALGLDVDSRAIRAFRPGRDLSDDRAPRARALDFLDLGAT